MAAALCLSLTTTLWIPSLFLFKFLVMITAITYHTPPPPPPLWDSLDQFHMSLPFVVDPIFLYFTGVRFLQLIKGLPCQYTQSSVLC